jgi:hypothetical protein
MKIKSKLEKNWKKIGKKLKKIEKKLKNLSLDLTLSEIQILSKYRLDKIETLARQHFFFSEQKKIKIQHFKIQKVSQTLITPPLLIAFTLPPPLYSPLAMHVHDHIIATNLQLYKTIVKCIQILIFFYF